MEKKTLKKTIAFIDGQNLFYAVKNDFDCKYPNYDPKKLAHRVCEKQGWRLIKTCFYTGVPKSKHNQFWHDFWAKKITKLKAQKNVFVFSRYIHQRKLKFQCQHCDQESIFSRGDEKGIDIRIAIDAIRAVLRSECDVILLFSQDQDLGEVANEIKAIAKEQGKFIKVACAFPANSSQRGINKTDWIPFDKNLYDQCIDSKDYRSK